VNNFLDFHSFIIIFLKKESGMKKTTLENGVKIGVATAEQGQGISLRLCFSVGSHANPKGQDGLTHLLEHTVFAGTSTKDKFAIAQALREHQGEFSATISPQETNFHFQQRSSDIQAVMDLCSLASSIVQYPIFPQHEINFEKRIIANEIGIRWDDPFDRMFDMVIQQTLSGSAYANGVAGKIPDIQNVSREDLIRFHHQFYHGGNLSVAIIAPVNEDDLLDIVRNCFTNMRTGIKTLAPDARFQSGITSDFHPSRLQHISMARLFPTNDRRLLSPEELLLSSIIVGKSMERIRLETPHTYNGKVSYANSVYDFSQFIIRGSTQAETTEDLVRDLAHIYNSTLRGIHELPDDLMAHVKQIVCRNLDIANMDVSAQSEFLMRCVFHEIVKMDAEERIADVCRTTPEQLQAYVDHYLMGEEIAVATFGPRKDAPDLAFFQNAFSPNS
jgi:predicted Zn-dependent peptidase